LDFFLQRKSKTSKAKLGHSFRQKKICFFIRKQPRSIAGFAMHTLLQGTRLVDGGQQNHFYTSLICVIWVLTLPTEKNRVNPVYHF
jgi:hypothetical protein